MPCLSQCMTLHLIWMKGIASKQIFNAYHQAPYEKGSTLKGATLSEFYAPIRKQVYGSKFFCFRADHFTEGRQIFLTVTSHENAYSLVLSDRQ